MKFLRPLLIACALLAPSLASAQGFPSQTIRLIVPFPPGGPNDVIARVIAQRMAEILKQTIVIENRSGQAGVFGTDVVAKAKPDGYTIGIVSAGALAISPSMEKVRLRHAQGSARRSRWSPRCRKCWWWRPASPPTT